MLNERIKILREKEKMSQKVLAEKLGVTQQAVAKWEKGISEPDALTIKTMSEFFNVSTDYLLGRTDIMEQVTDPTTPDEANEILETLHKRPEMKTLFSISKKATKEDIERAVKIIEALKGE
ncbi:MAG: helix-turn-helix transcriptional regulator [Firmicutes bacterium]|nr:helix-turn-helix transcriptional regulator [Bacillota bacterium]